MLLKTLRRLSRPMLQTGMLAVSLYLIWFNSLQKTPQTEFAILVAFSFFFSKKQIL